MSIQRGGILDSQANLFAAGPAVPYLFARGSLINRQLIGAGITVRASSTASAQPALKVGAPVLNDDGDVVYQGAIAVGFLLADWNVGGANPVNVNTAKTIVGQPVVTTGPASSLPDGYAAIFDNFTGTNRVVGFGLVSNGVPVTATPASVAVANATSRLSDVWVDIDPAVRNDVLARTTAVQNGLHVAAPKALR